VFDVKNPDEEPSDIPGLEETEQDFLTRTGHTDPSPYWFTASYQEMNPESP
jgi:hypothetical protein